MSGGPRTRPAISVLLPVRDAARFLADCLDSLAAQSRDDFEIVAVDDGSRDGSGELLDRRVRSEPRLRVLHTPRRGLVPALNAGLAACRGELVARMDADDVALPRRFELQAAALADDPGLDVVSCLVEHFPREEVAEGFRVYERWLNSLVEHGEILRQRFVESPLPHPSVMLRRRLLERAGGYRDPGWPEDYDLWLRLAAAGARFGKVPRVLLRWRDHAERLTRTHGRYAVERFLRCKAHHLVRGPLARARRVVVWGAGQTGRRLSKHLIRGGAPLAAFVDVDPRKIGGSLRRRPIHPSDDLPELLGDDGRGVVLAAVASRGARGLIRERWAELGLVEGRDAWCVA